MSVELRSKLDGSCSAYGKMEEERSETGIKLEGSSSKFKKIVPMERLYPLCIGFVVVLNVILIILVAVVFSRTGQLNSVTVTDGKDDVKAPAKLKANVEQKILQGVRRNGDLTVNVTNSLKQDFLAMMKSLYTLLGWKKSGNVFYKLITDYRVSYSSAKTRCRVNGGRLAAKIFRDTAAVKEMIKNKIVNHKDISSFIWIGLNDLNTEGSWEWIDGGRTSNVTTDWWPGEPNQSGGNEDCGNLIGLTDSKILINDAPCFHSYYYMCEIEIPENLI